MNKDKDNFQEQCYAAWDFIDFFYEKFPNEFEKVYGDYNKQYQKKEELI